jgi:DNA-binding LacI/PurR family transcriptional regulator
MDVARLAGVHVSTVSRVLRDSPQLNIRAETRLRIKAAAEELGYRPNAVARALRLASTGALGMLIPSLRNPVYAEITRGAFERAWERNFVVLLAEDRGGGDAERAYERLVESGRIDGLLIAGDLSLVTYDDDPISDYLAPPLTGIRMPMHEMGMAGVDALLARLEGLPAEDVTVATPPRLVLRSSTAPPRLA